jgi:hypothetical protein
MFTPAPDVANRLREIAHSTDRSLSAVVDDLVRVALSHEGVNNSRRKPYVVEPYDFRPLPGIDLSKPSQLLADIEDYEC